MISGVWSIVIARLTDISMSSRECFICSAPGQFSCPDCQLAFCCSDHGDLHRGDSCYPFTVLQAQGVGRYVVAARDIRQGEVVFEETEPLVVGPNQECQPVCLSCLTPLVEDEEDGGGGGGQIDCGGCGYQVCGADCEKRHRESRECQILGSAKPPVPAERYHHILPLRLLLLEAEDPGKARLAEMFMDHREEREGTEYWSYGRDHIVPFIRDQCGQTQWTEQQVMRATGILEVNCYEVKNFVTFGLRGFFPLASLLSHSCIANVKTVWEPGPPWGHRTVAVRDIKAGEEILTSYLRPSMCALLRRKAIKTGWYFDCSCPRCVDPRELGANTNTLLCPACSRGHLLPSSPLEYQSDWVCDQCSHIAPSDLVQGVVELYKQQIQTTYETDRQASYSDNISSSYPTQHFQQNPIKRHKISQDFPKNPYFPLIIQKRNLILAE